MERRDLRFPFAERTYLLQAIRFVHRIFPVERPYPPDSLPETVGFTADIWAVAKADASPRKETFCRTRGVNYHVLDLPPIPILRRQPLSISPQKKNKRILVTGSFDWLHSGHVRFLEEASAHGDLYVGVGSDANIRLLKGRKHPLSSEGERLYLVRSIRYVKRAFLTSGSGWLDAEPDISVLRPHAYIVNEDGDRPEKREFCRRNGIEYLVLKRKPRSGLPRRDSTSLRGF